MSSGQTSEAYQAGVDGWVRLLTYVQEVAKEIGEEKAMEILAKTHSQAHKRWLEDNASKLDLSGPPLLAAYRMVFGDMMGLDLSKIDIVAQTEDRIVHNYAFPCSILDACVKLGLDTRKICKALEKPANTLMQFVDPKLRFGRDYEKIRPYADYCVEICWLEK